MFDATTMPVEAPDGFAYVMFLEYADHIRVAITNSPSKLVEARAQNDDVSRIWVSEPTPTYRADVAELELWLTDETEAGVDIPDIYDLPFNELTDYMNYNIGFGFGQTFYPSFAEHQEV